MADRGDTWIDWGRTFTDVVGGRPIRIVIPEGSMLAARSSRGLGEFLPPAGLRRGGSLAGRRRHSAHDPVSEADGLGDSLLPPQPTSRGLQDGSAIEAGATHVRRLDGKAEELAASAQTVLDSGEAVTATTPTPGGFGAN